jgi:hypothetical protein
VERHLIDHGALLLLALLDEIERLHRLSVRQGCASQVKFLDNDRGDLVHEVSLLGFDATLKLKNTLLS